MKPVMGFVIALTIALGLPAECQNQDELQNRMQVILQAAPDRSHPWPESTAARRELMEQAREVVFNRLRAMPISDADISVQEDNKLILTFSSESRNAADILRRLTSTAQLELYWLKNIQGRNDRAANWRAEAPAEPGGAYLSISPEGETINSIADPQGVFANVVGLPKNRPVLTGRDLLPNAMVNFDRNNKVVVNIEFNSKGKDVFRDFTTRHNGDIVGVFFDGKLLAAPVIAKPIPDGKAEFSGFRDLAAAQRVADHLNSGTLPIPLKVVTFEHRPRT